MVFIGKNINGDLHGRRLALTQNDADNGFELWRALFKENEGGAEQVALGGMSNLHAFPQCPRVEDLQHWLGQWQMTRQKFGADLPEVHLRQMFLNMLPTSVSEKLRERKDLHTLQSYIDEVDADLGRLNDARLAKIQAQRMNNALKAGSRTPVNAVVEEPSDSTTPQPSQSTTGNEEITKKLDTLISVMSSNATRDPRGRQVNAIRDNRARSKSPRGIDPAWEKEGKGCLHCGGRGHKRKECNKFKKLLADNGDKLPTGYKGAYEKWKDQRKKTSVSVVSEVDDSDLDEFMETNLVWSLPTKSGLKRLPMPSTPITPIFNNFAELNEEDDEGEVMAALQQLTPNIRIGPKTPQKLKKGSKPMSKDRIAHIARQVQNGDIDLPSLDLASDSEYEAVWALVDSGAGKSCANKVKHFTHLKTKNKTSDARMATASGQELKSQGTFEVQARTSEGQIICPKFEDTDVEMPILAVNDISHDDMEVTFKQDRGELVSGNTGKRSKFVKRKGVHFMKMYYQKEQCMDNCECDGQPSFGRPGKP